MSSEDGGSNDTDNNSNNKVTIRKRTFILSLVVVVSLSVFLVMSGPMLSSLSSITVAGAAGSKRDQGGSGGTVDKGDGGGGGGGTVDKGDGGGDGHSGLQCEKTPGSTSCTIPFIPRAGRHDHVDGGGGGGGSVQQGGGSGGPCHTDPTTGASICNSPSPGNSNPQVPKSTKKLAQPGLSTLRVIMKVVNGTKKPEDFVLVAEIGGGNKSVFRSNTAGFVDIKLVGGQKYNITVNPVEGYSIIRNGACEGIATTGTTTIITNTTGLSQQKITPTSIQTGHNTPRLTFVQLVNPGNPGCSFSATSHGHGSIRGAGHTPFPRQPAGGPTSCPAGQTLCTSRLFYDAGLRECANLQSDVFNCGICGHTCGIPEITIQPGGRREYFLGGTQVCVMGHCQSACHSGMLDNDDRDTNCGGSCVNIRNDPHNCGGCHQNCAPGETCVNRQCTNYFSQCRAGLTSCNGISCTNTQTDASNCGACGRACTGGQTCQSGSCRCPEGLTACGSSCCVAGQTCNNGRCGAPATPASPSPPPCPPPVNSNGLRCTSCPSGQGGCCYRNGVPACYIEGYNRPPSSSPVYGVTCNPLPPNCPP